MIRQVTVTELYAMPGFEEMIAEYAKLAIKKLPAPLYRKEDYLPLEAAGLLTVWCAMYGGMVVGFASCLISKIPHYGIPIAIAESLFVRESVRGTGAGIRFIDAIERHATSSGVQAVFFSCPIGSEFKTVLTHRNYSAETTTFVKSLCQP
jgi:GNAT superfamily N-acetyltransferase